MKIAIIGATGFVGSGILWEALARGHEVTAIVRNPKKLPAHQKLIALVADVADTAGLAALVEGHDVVISAYNPATDRNGAGTRSIIDAVKRSGVQRLLAVGGAGTLEVAPGQRLVDQPEFPAEWKEGALRTAAFLDQLLGEREVDWVFVSPAAILAPGERTGTYRSGGDQMLHDADGKSRISIADYAIAMLDEAETPKHSRSRFSVAY